MVCRQFVPAVTAALLAGGLACLLARLPPSERPQVAQGADVLAVAFGDARKAISAAFLSGADSYFHGGIDMDGGCLHHDHDGAEHHGHDAVPKDVASGKRGFDPWRWINAHVRAPQIERHLQGRQAVEMIPLLWASVRADVHNVEAWTTAWYIAERVMRDTDLALRIIREGVRENPEDSAVALTYARALFRGGGGDLSAAESAFGAARGKARARCGGDLAGLSDAEAETYASILGYLAWFADRRGDRAGLERLLGEVRATGRPSPTPATIERYLAK